MIIFGHFPILAEPREGPGGQSLRAKVSSDLRGKLIERSSSAAPRQLLLPQGNQLRKSATRPNCLFAIGHIFFCRSSIMTKEDESETAEPEKEALRKQEEEREEVEEEEKEEDEEEKEEEEEED